MTAKDWGEVERLFHQATQHAPSERAAFVASIRDVSVRAEVASLLAAGATPGSYNVETVIGHAARAALEGPSPGDQIGHFRVIREVGRGAMGSVYLAEDLNLGRKVALKLLPAAFVADASRLRRFEREARAAAALNHPNIMAIHEVGHAGGRPFIAAEYIEGDTLADRLRRGPLAQQEAIRLGHQIAEALALAHEHGVIHRDLKPANIKVRPDGTAKVLDFGLAKVAPEPRAASTADDVAPVVATSTTVAGTILGTPAYMSPEQARGLPADKRTDIWAFGAVLYEMLTGKRVFERATMSDTLSAVLHEEPDLTKVPARLRAVVRRCLIKDLHNRWQDIGDVRIALDEDLDEPLAPAVPRAPSPLRWVAGLAAIAAVLGASFVMLRPQPQTPMPQALIRLNVDLGPEANLANDRGKHTLAISPDGTRVAFACQAPGGELRICTRVLDQHRAVPLAGTEGVQTITFSPDGKWLAFTARGKLRKASVEGGSPIALADAPFERGTAWSTGGFIIAALNSQEGLMRVQEAGGTPEPVTQFKPGEIRHRWPQILPGGDAVLFTASAEAGNYENASLDVVSLETGVRKTLHRGGYYGRYLPSGHLVYMHQGTLFAARANLERLALTSTPTPVLDDVATRPGDGGADFDFSQSGTFVYQSSKSRGPTTIQWLQPSEMVEPLLPTPGAYESLRFSPDGKRLALVIDSTGLSGGPDLWVYDLERGTTSRITSGGANESPVWSRDGRHLAHASGAAGAVLWSRADGSGDAHRLSPPGWIQVDGFPSSMSSDGKRLALQLVNPDVQADIFTIMLEGADTDRPKPGPPEAFLRTPASEGSPAFAPDGRWLAYVSDESGSNQVYVRPFPADAAGGGGKWQVSTNGGTTPIWSPNGRELFYVSSDRRITVVAYTASAGSFQAGTPARWSDVPIMDAPTVPYIMRVLDLAPDGKRFAVIAPAAGQAQKPLTHVNVLLNFFDELERRTAPGK